MVGQVLDFRKLDANAFAMTPKSAALLPLADSVCRHCRAFLMPTVDLKCVPIEPPPPPHTHLWDVEVWQSFALCQGCIARYVLMS